MNKEISSYLKYANLQIAAEALYGLKAASAGSPFQGDIDVQVLMLGNERTSKFTATQAQSFIAEGWTIADHISNTRSGFSGTLFKNKETGELVMSFRSTEFVDDAVRDNQATNSLEIKAKGWAFGQIADMEAWYASLKNNGELSQSDALAVTGYSLGGHLATAFNLLRQEEAEKAGGAPNPIVATYTFNGAGVGKLLNGASLGDVVREFQDIRQQGAAAKFLTDQGRAVYQQIKVKLSAHAGASEISAALDRLALLLPDRAVGSLRADYDLLADALSRARVVAAEVVRVADLSGASTASRPWDVQLGDIDAVGLDYQLGVLIASRRTEAYAALNVFDGESGANNTLRDERNTSSSPIAGFHDIYASNYPSAVSNSQLHYGAASGVIVEDQPLVRGNYLAKVLADTGLSALDGFDVKLLVDRFDLNDFGDTHSLVLIVDSLSVQNVLAQIDSQFTTAKFAPIMQAATNTKGESAALGQGKAEGDALDKIVVALAKQLGVSMPELNPSLNGNTWYDVEDKDGHTGRSTFHSALKAIVDSSVFEAIKGNAVVRASSSDLRGAARNDFGAVAALMALSPFWIAGKDAAGKAALEAAWAVAHSEDFLAWQRDKSAAIPGTFTDQWIEDRSTALGLFTQRNMDNVQGVLPGSTNTRYYDVATDTQILVGTGSASRHQYIFGDASSETVTGQGLRDHLYGGGGDDSLSGLGGDDYLQGDAGDDQLDGGAGNDQLIGGKGNDSYTFTGQWGRDTVIDGDGAGTLKIEGITLDSTGAKLKGQTTQPGGGTLLVWQETVDGVGEISYRYDSATRLLNILTSKGQIDITNFSNGQLGLSLPVAPEAVEVATYSGVLDFAQPNNYAARSLGSHLGNDVFLNASQAANGGAASRLQEVDAWAGDDVIEGGASAAVRAIALRGAAGQDRVFARTRQTLEQALADSTLQQRPSNASVSSSRYLLDGGTGNDLIVGSSEDDALFGGDGDDTIVGGAGGDVILADGDAGRLRPVEGDIGSLGINFDATNWRWVTGSNAPSQLQMRALALPQYLGALTARYPNSFQSSSTAFGRLVTQVSADVDYAAFATAFAVSEAAAQAQGIVAPSSSTYEFDGRIFLDLTPRGGMTEDTRSFATTRYASNDIVYAGAGDDVVNAGGGNDVVLAGGDKDFVLGYDGNDVLYGEGGDDVIFGDYQADGGTPQAASWLGVTYENLNALDAKYHGNDFIDGGKGSDRLAGNGGDDDIIGGEGDDELYGDEMQTAEDVASPSGNDRLDGGSGDDLLIGGGGNDVLIGGEGADVLQGGTGDDTYFMDGLDTSLDSNGTNRYVINAADGGYVRLTDSGKAGSRVEIINASGENLKPIMYLSGSTQSVQVGNLTLQGSGWLDGSLTALSVNGTWYNAEWLRGTTPTPQYPTINGNSEQVLTGAGDDVITVNGTGNRVIAGAGTDSITFNAVGNEMMLRVGDGSDYVRFNPALVTATSYLTLVLGEGLSLSTVRLELLKRSSGNAIRVYPGEYKSDSVVLSMHGQDLEALMGRIVVSAGRQSATLASLLDSGHAVQGGDGADGIQAFSRPSLLLGGAGNDSLRGSSFDDVLDGGTGDDYLEGGAGDDIYRWRPGDGTDRIHDVSGFDTLEVSGLLPSQLRARSDNGRLELVADSGEILRIEHINGVPDVLDRVKFSDGTILSAAVLREQALRATQQNDSITGFDGDDHIQGLAGNDYLDGGSGGNDWLEGGEGDDYLITRSYYTPSILDGGPGNDEFRGYGSATYIVGDGHDYVWAATHESNVLKFVLGFTPDNVTVRAGGNLVFFKDDLNGVQIYNMFAGWSGAFRHEDFTNHPWTFVFADGTVWTIEDVFDRALAATAGNDHIYGFETDDVLNGDAGDDKLSGMDGNDTLDGGVGNDFLSGGQGDDTYLWGIGSGDDTIDDTTWLYSGGGLDTLSLIGIDPGGIAFAKRGKDLIVRAIQTNETLTIKGHFTSPDSYGNETRIERVRYADGTVADLPETFEGLSVDTPIKELAVWEDEPINWTVPADTFSSSEGLNVIVRLPGGGALPDWLSFDPLSRVLSGTPSNTHVGKLALELVAEDEGGRTAINLFQLRVVNVNDAPISLNTLAAQDATQDALWAFTLPEDVFLDIDAEDRLTWHATLTDGSDLPEWLRFDGVARTFSGTPGAAQVGSLALKVTVTDGAAATASQQFELNVAARPDGETLAGTKRDGELSASVDITTPIGLEGNDSYPFGLDSGYGYGYGYGYGFDYDYDSYDTTPYAYNIDITGYGANVSVDELWFSRAVRGLSNEIIGTDNRLTISNWYASSSHRIERFKTADGKTLLDSRVQIIVDAMAAFSPPAAGQTTLPNTHQSGLNSVIAANWQ